MEQKTTLKHYSIIGISLMLTLFNLSCKSEEEIEYRLDVDIIYKNETNHLINYYQYDQSLSDFKVLAFTLLPNNNNKMEIRGNGPKTTLNNCCEGIFESFQGTKDILIDYDNNDKCLVYLAGEGSTTENINIGYNIREIENGYYEFIYTFTENEYDLANNCE